MTNINLSPKGLGSENKAEKIKLFSKGFIIIFLILILIVALYVVLLFGKTYLARQVKSVAEEQKNMLDSLVGNEKSINVVDFQRRTEVAKSFLGENQNMAEYLGYLEQTIVPQVKLKEVSFNEEEKMIIITCLADGYRFVATQILSFKNSGFFASVIGGENNFNEEENKIEFMVKLKLK